MGQSGKRSRLDLVQADPVSSQDRESHREIAIDGNGHTWPLPPTVDQLARDGLASRRQTLSLLLVLIASLVAYTWVRTRDLDRVVTVDEPVFLTISANFANALAHGDLRDTSQFLYPAVPIMWAGTIGIMIDAPNFTNDYPDQIRPLDAANEPLRSVGHQPLDVLNAARIAKVILQAIVFLIGVWLVYRLFGLAVAALAASFIIFDPFLVAHDQLLHVDGFTGMTAFVAMLAAANADRDRTNKWWALAGVMAALCWLTRLTGLVLLPIFALLIADRSITDFRTKRQTGMQALASGAKSLGWVLGVSALATFILWPALWVDPVETIQVTIHKWQRSVETPHPWGLFFEGETVTGDPGVLFYVYVFLYKITPVTFLGLGVALFALLFRITSIISHRMWRPAFVLASFVVVYSVGMALGERKFDRYILPNFLFIDLFAAIGIVGLARLVWTRPAVAWRTATATVIVALIAGQMAFALAQRPYPLDYFNPVMGGTKSAEDTIMIGWGEGFDQAAKYILAQPGGDSAEVQVSTRSASMQYFFPDTVTVRNLAGLQPDQASIQKWANTDYAVIHVLQWQRDSTGRVIHYFDRFRPVHTVKINGAPFVKVYDVRKIPPPDWMTRESACSWQIGDYITLVAYGPHKPESGENPASNEQMIEIIYQTTSVDRLPSSFDVDGELVPRSDEGDPIAFSTTIEPNRAVGMLAKSVQTVQLPEGKKLSDFWLRTTVRDPETGDAIPTVKITNSARGNRAGRPEC
jgi:hypothetical protein